MCETMQSSHLLSDVLGVEVFFVALTVSSDGPGTRFCTPLPPSPPPFSRHVLKTLEETLTNFWKILFLTPFFFSWAFS